MVSGSYILNMHRWSNLLFPFSALFKEKSAMMMLAVACIWGVSSSFHTIGVKQTYALFLGHMRLGSLARFYFPWLI